uniref:Sialyltransferase n=1 Tax=Panagrolaimus sp. ES5 TaxID=591445 RepID=A0AC34GPF5_9BILA
MAFSLRSIRRFLRIGYVSPRSCFTNFLYIAVIFITFSFVATQLKAQKSNEITPPHPGEKAKFDLHNEFQVNRQRLADYHAQERARLNDLPLRGDNVPQQQHQQQQHHRVQQHRNILPADALGGRKEINGQPYPKLVNGDKFVPLRKLVHLDLKGGAYKGLIITGWSRYDHMAVLAELLPVNLPTLVMSIETIDSGRPLHGNFPKSNQLLQCTAKYDQGFIYGCQFPGRKVYELINEMHSQKDSMHKYVETDYEFNGWLSKVAEKYHFSSPMYIEKISQFIDYNLNPLERIEKDLRLEMSKIYFNETIDEFIFTYLSDELELLRKRKAAMSAILSAPSYQKRPYIKYPSKNDL